MCNYFSGHKSWQIIFLLLFSNMGVRDRNIYSNYPGMSNVTILQDVTDMVGGLYCRTRSMLSMRTAMASGSSSRMSMRFFGSISAKTSLRTYEVQSFCKLRDGWSFRFRSKFESTNITCCTTMKYIYFTEFSLIVLMIFARFFLEKNLTRFWKLSEKIFHFHELEQTHLSNKVTIHFFSNGKSN